MKKIASYIVSTAAVAGIFATSASAVTPVTAYIDPSVTTTAIQAFAGIAVAVGAVIAVFWRKAKKKVTKTLNIDENANKEVEEDIVVFEENGENAENDENKTGDAE